MLTCQQATRLVSERQDRPLRGRERVGLWVHLMMCRFCRAFERQLAYLQAIARRHTEAGLASGGPALSAEAKARLKDSLADPPR